MAGASVPLRVKGVAVVARLGLGSGSGTSETPSAVSLALARGVTGIANARPGVSGGATIASIGPLGLRSGRGTLVVAVAESVFGLASVVPLAVAPGEALRSGRATFVVAVAGSCCGVTVAEAPWSGAG